MKSRRYNPKKPIYKNREQATIGEAYQLLGSVLVGLKKGDVKILDNLDDLMGGKKPRWGEKALRKGSMRNFKALFGKEGDGE